MTIGSTRATVTEADALAEDRSPVFEVGENLQHGPFRDSDGHSQVADPNARILRHGNEDVGMVAQERPRVPGCPGSMAITTRP